MIQSMTGYGKAEAKIAAGTLTLEIRTLNGKGADVSVKTSLLPKDREMQVRARLAAALQRGTIDFFATFQAGEAGSAHPLDAGLAASYLRQAEAIDQEIAEDPAARAQLLAAILRLPDVVETKKADVVTDEDWPAVEAALEEAIAAVEDYRRREGEALYRDVTARIATIGALYDEVEQLEGERIETVKAKLNKALDELQARPDPSRYEQELIFYLEKYDINEEKVRLRQHCRYFLDTIDGDPAPGKKLGFIIQEMGREINTTGSKANHAGIQRLVVRMKDELEKIREQSMNIL